jgi:hypothetical protein
MLAAEEGSSTSLLFLDTERTTLTTKPVSAMNSESWKCPVNKEDMNS